MMGAGHDHGHDHGHGPTTAGRLAASAGIFFVSFLLQGLGGFWSGSVGLVSDSLENLNDVLFQGHLSKIHPSLVN